MLAGILAACGGSTSNTTEAVSADTEVQVTTSVAPSGDSSGSSGAIDVCAMLTDSQIEEATGFAVISKEPGGGQGFATGACSWVLDTDEPASGLDGFSVSVVTPGGRSRFDVLAGEMPQVPEIGDDAYQQGDSIWAIVGDGLVILDFAFLHSALGDPGQAVVPLIEIILSQL